jgi:hypothetical protein
MRAPQDGAILFAAPQKCSAIWVLKPPRCTNLVHFLGGGVHVSSAAIPIPTQSKAFSAL